MNRKIMSMLKKKLFSSWNYCCLLLLFTASGICQENYKARWYTADNNELPQSSVKAIVQSKYNFIWITTENGLVRYDGNIFYVFNSNTTNLKQCRFTAISGSVQKDSLYCYNEGKTELVLIHNRKVQIIKNKRIEFNITRNGKRYFYHDGLPSINTINPHEPYYITLPNGNMYFIDNEVVELCNAKMKSIYKIAYKNNTIFNFFVLGSTLYYLKENGDYDYFSNGVKYSGKLDPSLFKTKHKLYWNLTANQIFLCSKNKIQLLTVKNNRLEALPIVNFNEFSKSNIVSIFYDQKSRKLYLGSNTNGLCIISFPAFKTVKSDSRTTDVFYAALPFTDNSIVDVEGLIINNKKVVDSLPFEQSTFYTERISMAKDDDENIWIVLKSNVHCYLKKTGYKKYILYPFKQIPKTLFKDQNNTIWLSLNKDEFHKSKLYAIKNGETTHFRTTESNINCIKQYDSNTLYLGCENGLFKYEINSGRLLFVKNSEKINVRSIFIDSGKKIWLTTYEKGFFLYSDNALLSFPKDKNNYLNSSHCIVEDKNGFFWIPTNKGLFQVSRSTLLKYSKSKRGPIYYHQYNKEDGFLTNEFNGGCDPCGNFLKNNEIVFPSMNGFVFFNPYKVSPLLPSQEIFIDKVIVDQKTYSPKDTITLENNFQRVSFLIAYPYYGNPENINIEAKLDKITNSRWEKIGTDKLISFTTLPPGDYTLTLRTMSGFNAGYTYKKIALIVPEKFYQTLWFTIFFYFLALVFVLLIWYARLYYIKLNNKKLEDIIEEKTRRLAKTVHKLKKTQDNLKQEIKQQETLVKSMSHDIKSPLKFLNTSINHIFDNENIQEDQKLKRQIENIQLSSLQLYEYVENLIKYSTIFIEGKKLEDKSYSLYELIEEKIQIFEKIAATENTVIYNDIHPDIFIRTNKKALSIIIHNLLDNAVKNTKDGQIELQCTTKENLLAFIIVDNGKGMPQEQIDYYLDFYKNPISKNYHLGLHMIIELLLIIKGEINIISRVNEGTTIEIIVEYN